MDAFFYGLYMDETVLAGMGVTPRHPRKARADGLALRIGRRATLVPRAGANGEGQHGDGRPIRQGQRHRRL